VNRLTQIQRQADHSSIIRAAHAINNGQSIKHLTASDFLFIEEEDPPLIKERIVRIIAGGTQAPIEDIQVLSPMKKDDAGTKELNLALREVSRQHNVFRLAVPDSDVPVGGFLPGDKVIQLENNYEKDVFNGETGYVVVADPEEKTVTVLFENKKITYDDFEIDQIGLAYALTVHKYQGSEIPCVIMPLTTQHYIMLYRNLLYTAVTRAKNTLILVGSQKALAIAVKNDAPVLRYSGLGC